MRLRRKEFILTCEGHLDQNAMFRRPHGQSVSFLRNHPRDAKKNWTKLVWHSATCSVAWFLCLLHARSLPFFEIDWSNTKQCCFYVRGQGWDLVKHLAHPCERKMECAGLCLLCLTQRMISLLHSEMQFDFLPILKHLETVLFCQWKRSLHHPTTFLLLA